MCEILTGHSGSSRNLLVTTFGRALFVGHILNTSSDNKDESGSSKLVSSLEKIDDDLDKNGVTLVKLAVDNPDNDMERLQIDELPAIVFYDNKFPTTFKGKLICD